MIRCDGGEEGWDQTCSEIYVRVFLKLVDESEGQEGDPVVFSYLGHVLGIVASFRTVEPYVFVLQFELVLFPF